MKLAKAARVNRPLPQWTRFKTGSTIRYNAKRRRWRQTKLGLTSIESTLYQLCKCEKREARSKREGERGRERERARESERESELVWSASLESAPTARRRREASARVARARHERSLGALATNPHPPAAMEGDVSDTRSPPTDRTLSAACPKQLILDRWKDQGPVHQCVPLEWHQQQMQEVQSQLDALRQELVNQTQRMNEHFEAAVRRLLDHQQKQHQQAQQQLLRQHQETLHQIQAQQKPRRQVKPHDPLLAAVASPTALHRKTDVNPARRSATASPAPPPQGSHPNGAAVSGSSGPLLHAKRPLTKKPKSEPVTLEAAPRTKTPKTSKQLIQAGAAAPPAKVHRPAANGGNGAAAVVKQPSASPSASTSPPLPLSKPTRKEPSDSRDVKVSTESKMAVAENSKDASTGQAAPSAANTTREVDPSAGQNRALASKKNGEHSRSHKMRPATGVPAGSEVAQLRTFIQAQPTDPLSVLLQQCLDGEAELTEVEFRPALDAEGVRLLCYAAACHTGVEVLSLSNNQLKNDGAKVVAVALANGWPLTGLRLGPHLLPQRDLGHPQPATPACGMDKLCDQWKVLTFLDIMMPSLASNSIKAEGIAELAMALRENVHLEELM
ncbi:uncharacterized protein MONBRDRAFT_32764 [Monosiga brevicollis MX1]|uniref:60S ribosomal protein L39 n=1 Tax=Monosiga brevicollis TaxID=81824 RepID=A9V1L2_MONBE|nr:uncharacterized protein MONBRDRAFT_32764 [Monosiga brevicollis MX1]EDQ88587.1 predicted protein [Monosiga brevicollis MX1]|eukprot:XP_001746691.1 hypothetical protein [Monosiga brevicollis MX1]